MNEWINQSINQWMNERMNERMYVSTYVPTYVRTYVCMYVCMYVGMYVCMYVFLKFLYYTACSITLAILHARDYLYIYIYIYIYVKYKNTKDCFVASLLLIQSCFTSIYLKSYLIHSVLQNVKVYSVNKHLEPICVFVGKVWVG
jgi:hypothetical protein